MSKVANLPHTTTGIEVLDQVLPTGLPATGTVLLLCDPGSGGENLLRQLLIQRLHEQQSVLYLTLDNFPENIRQLIYGVAEDVEWSSLLFVDCYSKTVGAKTDEAYVEDPENLSAISIVISSVIAERTVSLIVLDSLNTVIRRRDLRSAIEFLRVLVARARQGKCLSLVMLNRKGFLPSTLASAQEIVDGVIELKIEESSRDIIRSLRVSKMVGLKHLTMWTPYEVTDAGDFVPVIRPVERRENNNLPARLTPIVGREIEVAEARSLFLQKNARLVTFTGPGGAGKTSLGLEVARSLIGQFAEGTYFVSLAHITDSKLLTSVLPSAITQAMGLRERKDISTPGILQEYLRNKEVLLFLDNFEQIVSSALQLADLLAACPKLRLIVTSRQALRIRGEEEFPVPPLSLPDLKRLPPATELLDYDAVKLFVQRAQAVNPDFRISDENAREIAEICVGLDGLPLAIELVAPMLKAYSPDRIMMQLKDNTHILKGPQDLPERQRTLQAAIQWSYDLLNDDERSLFEKLSVFIGGFTAEAAVSVCSEDSVGRERVTEDLSSLVDKNLVVREVSEKVTRFTMLNIIHAFAVHSLANGQKEHVMRKRHANYFLAFVEGAEPELLGPNQVEWLDRLELEHDNLRSALEWYLKQRDSSGALRMGAGLWRFWYARGYLTDGVNWLSRCLATTSDPTFSRAEVLIGAGALAHTQGRYPEARRFYEESLEIFRKLSDKRGIAASLNNLGSIANDQEEYSEARRLFEESLAISRELGDEQAKSHLINNLALLAQETGQYALSKSLFDESLTIKRQLNDERGIAATILNLGNIARDTANYEAAHTHYQESLVLFKKLGETRGIAYCLNNLALVAIGVGDFYQAKVLLDECLPLFEQLGDQLGFSVFLQTRADLARAKQDYRLASVLYKDSLRSRTEIGDKVGIIECIEGLASIAIVEGQAELAVRLFAAAQSFRKNIGVPLPPAEEGGYKSEVHNARNHMTGKDFETVWDEGARMKTDELVELGLEWKGRKP